jgi:hypothetical protein
VFIGEGVWAEMICYRWDISGSMGMDCPCLGDLVLPSSCCVGVVVVSARALWWCSSKFVTRTKSTTRVR